MSEPSLSPTERSTIVRGKKRAVTDRSALHAILDEAVICHFGVVVDGAPRVLPTGYGRDGDTLYLHGSSGARSLRSGAGTEICVSVTIVDGIVYARSAFHFSANYRSAVIHGAARLVTDEDERLHAMRVLTEHMAPGAWDHVREPNAKEMAKTSVLALDLSEAAVKVRSGDPVDEPEDIDSGGVWAGVLPLQQHWGTPEPSADLADVTEVPAHIRDRGFTTLVR